MLTLFTPGRYEIQCKMEGVSEKSRSYLGNRGELRVSTISSSQTTYSKQALTLKRSASLVLEAYWKKIGGKPTVPSKISKKRGRQSLSGNGSTNNTPKKQKRGRKSTHTLSLDQTPEPPTGFTQVGDDDWEPPPPNKDAWDPLVQSIDTIERDDDGELWAYLLWNDKNGDGRFYRSKARVPTCNQACPQRVCLPSFTVSYFCYVKALI